MIDVDIPAVVIETSGQNPNYKDHWWYTYKYKNVQLCNTLVMKKWNIPDKSAV